MATNPDVHRSRTPAERPQIPGSNANRQTREQGVVSPEAPSVTLTGETDSLSLPQPLSYIDSESDPPTFGLSPTLYSLGILLVLVLLIGGALGVRRTLRRAGQEIPGGGSFWGHFSRLPIPLSKRSLHDSAFTRAEVLAERVSSLDSERFREADFLCLVNWKRDIALAAGGERHLARSIERLEGALKAFALYRTAERLASTDPEPGHREFYRSVSYLLAECPDRETFRHLLREKCEGLSRSPGSSGDGTRLPDYFQTLDALAGDDDGFALLRLLKDSRSGCRSAIGLVADELDRVERQESPLEPAIANSLPEREQTFVHLKPILDLPESEFFAGAFGKILRYIALERRYGGAFDKYEESVVLMGEWYLSYQVVSAIRKEYPPADYRQPKTFRLTVPGLELYRMYGDSANYPIGEGVVEL